MNNHQELMNLLKDCEGRKELYFSVSTLFELIYRIEMNTGYTLEIEKTFHGKIRSVAFIYNDNKNENKVIFSKFYKYSLWDFIVQNKEDKLELNIINTLISRMDDYVNEQKKANVNKHTYHATKNDEPRLM